jgi:hypothetical protein
VLSVCMDHAIKECRDCVHKCHWDVKLVIRRRWGVSLMLSRFTIKRRTSLYWIWFSGKVKLKTDKSKGNMSYNKIEFHSFLTLIVDKVGGQRHAPAALPKERSPGTRWTEGRVGPRTSLEWCGRKKVSWSTGVQTRTVQPAPPTQS